MQRRLAAILAADVAGYTKLVERDTEGTVAAWRAARAEIIDPGIAAHAGRLVKLTGDGFLAEFASVQNAVACALEMQVKLRETALDFRMGINTGDVVDDGEDIHGEGVNIAARIEALAPLGGISISGGVHEQVRNRIETTFADAGEHLVKHVSAPVRVWQWSPDGVATVAEPTVLQLPDKPSIAVLPFDNMSGDPEQGFFADGIAEDIITEISRIPALFVIARNSTFTYKGKSPKVPDVCRDLGVRFVLEGSVRKAGQRVRVTAQLIDGNSGGSVWGERYDRDLADIFAVQDDVTAKIAGALETNLVAGNRAEAERIETANPEAYDCVLRGREQYRMYTPQGNAAARDIYQRAIDLDPDYAEAHAGLAQTYLHDWFAGFPDALDRAFDLAQTARRLNPDLPLVYEALGGVHLFRRQYDEFIATAMRWLEIEPGNAEAYANLAGIHLFAGQPERVADLIDTAKRLNPFYPFYYNIYVGAGCLIMRRYAEALPSLRRAVDRNPDALSAQLFLAACHSYLDQPSEAKTAVDEALRISPDFSLASARSIYVFRREADFDLLIEGLRQAGLTDL